MLNSRKFTRTKAKQWGATSVEFGIIAVLFFTIFFGIIEFGRFFYLYNTVQEVTRCAAREGVVHWKSDTDKSRIQRKCIFQDETSVNNVQLVAGWEIQNIHVQLRYLHSPGATTEASPQPPIPNTPEGNLSECEAETTNCIRFVEASLWCTSGQYCNMATHRITYNPMFGLIPLTINIPNSTVTMPAESLGYQR